MEGIVYHTRLDRVLLFATLFILLRLVSNAVCDCLNEHNIQICRTIYQHKPGCIWIFRIELKQPMASVPPFGGEGVANSEVIN